MCDDLLPSAAPACFLTSPTPGQEHCQTSFSTYVHTCTCTHTHTHTHTHTTYRYFLTMYHYVLVLSSSLVVPTRVLPGFHCLPLSERGSLGDPRDPHLEYSPVCLKSLPPRSRPSPFEPSFPSTSSSGVGSSDAVFTQRFSFLFPIYLVLYSSSMSWFYFVFSTLFFCLSCFLSFFLSFSLFLFLSFFLF